MISRNLKLATYLLGNTRRLPTFAGQQNRYTVDVGVGNCARSDKIEGVIQLSIMSDLAWQSQKKFLEVQGRRMAYVEEGDGETLLFAHGNPTSSYLWRNIMPACRGLGRLIACDMIGMGDSEKLLNSSAAQYTYSEHRSFLFELWDKLQIGNRVILILHDWGTALGFEWASQNTSRVQGIVFMEAFVLPLKWSDFSASGEEIFRALRSSEGEEMVLNQNIFVEKLLPGAIKMGLKDSDMAEYRRPYLQAGEDRRPTLQWPRQIPIDGEPSEVSTVVQHYGQWLTQSLVPKLYVHTEPGEVDHGRRREFVRTWPNQEEVTVPGGHFVQEDSPNELALKIAAFIRKFRT